MRLLKWISALTILAMLFAVLPATVAEDEIVIDPVEVEDEAFEIEMDDAEALESIDDSVLALEDAGIELDGLEDDLLVYETEESVEAPAASNASGDFVIDEEGTLTRYAGFAKDVVIPDGVKAISGAFSWYTDLKSVSIPGSVTSIGYEAFEGCTALKSITLPDSVTNIGPYAFRGCTALASVKLSSALETLGYSAFSDCTSLKSIEIPDSIKSIDTWAFYGCTNLTSIKLPKSMTELSGGMFRDCDSLDNLDFLSCITKIDDALFYSCDGLKNITIPSSITSIGSGVFGDCENLECVTIHSGVTFIDRTAFDDSDNVTIRGTAGSYAESYANGMGIPFNAPVVTFNEKMLHNNADGTDYIVVYINQSRTLNAVQKPTDLARTLKWTSSNSKVVTVDQNGKIKGILQGTATITANTADGKGKAAQIKVYVPEPTKIDLSYNWDDDKTITLYQTGTIYAYKNTPYQYDTDVEMPVTWSSSDSSIISIESKTDDEATLKGKKLGKATITATTPDGGKSSMVLEVVRPEVDSVTIVYSGPTTLRIGEQCSLSAKLSPYGAESALTWKSYDTSVATVSSKGVVTAVAEGETEVSVRTTNGESDFIYINVIPVHPHPESIRINQTDPIKLYVGKQYTLTTTMTPADAEAKLTWQTNDSMIATVNSSGVVTAVAEGWTYIYVETDNGCWDEIEVEVLSTPEKVQLNKTKATLGVKEKLTLKATLTPTDAKTTLTWKSSKPKVATVSKDGVVTAKKVGTTVITVTAQNGRSAKATITVKAAPKSVKLNKKGTVTLKKGKTLKLKATPSKNSASLSMTWKSSKPKIASVDQNGNVTALKKGTTVISVKTFNKKTAKVTIKVK